MNMCSAWKAFCAFKVVCAVRTAVYNFVSETFSRGETLKPGIDFNIQLWRPLIGISEDSESHCKCSASSSLVRSTTGSHQFDGHSIHFLRFCLEMLGWQRS